MVVRAAGQALISAANLSITAAMSALEPMHEIALLAAALLALSWLWLRRRAPARPRRDPTVSTLDTLQAWPPQLVRVLTLPERRAYDLLRKSLPRNHLVLAQVPLSRFVSVPTRFPHDEWLKRVGRLSVDLLVCDASSRPIGAVEVRSTDETERSRARHARLAAVLEAAGLPVHVWRFDQLPSPNEVRRQIIPDAFTEPEKPSVDRLGRAQLPLPEIEELLAEGDSSMVRLDGEPVPSGFYDDLDAAARADR
jgi:hypothetical protein